MTGVSTATGVKVKLLLGIVSPRNIGYIPADEVYFDCETNSLDLPGASEQELGAFYKPLAGQTVTVRAIDDRSQKWTGILACHEMQGNKLYIKSTS